MRPLTTLLLAALALGLGLFAYLDHTGVLTTWWGKSEDPPFVIPVSKTITGFTLADASSSRSLEKRGDVWHVIEPVEDLADPDWVATALELFGATRPNTFLRDPEGAQRAEYGLSADEATTLTMRFTEGPPVIYHLGQPGPFANSTYLFLGEPDDYAGAFVATGDFRPVMEASVKEMIDPLLTRFEMEKAVGVTIGDEIALERDVTPGSRWRLVAPLQAQADEELVGALLGTFASAKTSEVLLEKPSESSDAVLQTVTIQLAEREAPIVLEIRPHPTDPELVWVVHSGRPLTYHLPRAFLAALPDDAESLRETRLLRLIEADVTAATITPKGGPALSLENSGVWLIKDGEALSVANAEQGARFIELLSDTRVEHYLEGGADKEAIYGLDDPLYTIELEGQKLGPLEKDKVTMRVGMPLGSVQQPRVFVAFDRVANIAAVPKGFLTGLAQAADLAKWRQLEVLNVAFTLIENVTITPVDESPLNLVIDFENEDAEKRLQLFEGGIDRSADMNRHAAGQLIMELGALSADRWLSSGEQALEALVNPTLTVVLKNRSGEAENERQEWTLHFAPVNPDVPAFYYGKLDSEEASEPFLISRELYERLSGERLLLETARSPSN